MKRPDSPTATSRRDALKYIGGALALIGCGATQAVSTDGGATNDLATAPGKDAAPTTCEEVADETIGPYPDKTGMLTNPTYARSDITEGKAGLTLSVVLTVVDTKSACAAVAGAQVIVWQCDAEGHYSEYASQPGGFDGTGAKFLRGVQTTDANGQVTFVTVYPGWYAGRATHIHAQVFVGGTSMKITQLAFPDAITTQVYATGVYAAKGSNPQTNATDMVFGDGVQTELVNLTGDVTAGFLATLTLGI